MSSPVPELLMLVFGVILAGLGGEIFVSALAGISLLARISPVIVASTIAAFATSSPELSVSVNSALQGTPQIALGDALGSNVVNIALILGIALLMSDIQCSRETMRRNFPLALIVPLVITAMSFDGVLSRVDGIMLLLLFLTWLIFTLREAHHQRSNNSATEIKGSIWRLLLLSFIGLVLLVISGKLIVSGSVSIAELYEIDPFLVGATIVCIGTSIPEMATTLISSWKGRVEIGLGTVLGSNLFNGLFIVPIAAIINPIPIKIQEVGVSLLFGFITVAFTYPSSNGTIGRSRGILLLVVYLIYMTTVIQSS